jgi:hypothetical protein
MNDRVEVKQESSVIQVRILNSFFILDIWEQLSRDEMSRENTSRQVLSRKKLSDITKNLRR